MARAFNPQRRSAFWLCALRNRSLFKTRSVPFLVSALSIVIVVSTSGCVDTSGSSAASVSSPDLVAPSSEIQSQSQDGPSKSNYTAVANAVCSEAQFQLGSIAGGEDIELLTCEAQTNSAGEVAMVLVLNDIVEWESLFMSQPVEELMFTVPLGLLAYAFAGSDSDPLTFDVILMAFRDPYQTVYEISPPDLRDVLGAQTENDASNALLELRKKIQISSLSQ